jgi:hypothetical protein
MAHFDVNGIETALIDHRKEQHACAANDIEQQSADQSADHGAEPKWNAVQFGGPHEVIADSSARNGGNEDDNPSKNHIAADARAMGA